MMNQSALCVRSTPETTLWVASFTGLSPQHITAVEVIESFCCLCPPHLVHTCAIEKAVERQEAAPKDLLIKPHTKNSVGSLGVSGSLYVAFSEDQQSQ